MSAVSTVLVVASVLVLISALAVALRRPRVGERKGSDTAAPEDLLYRQLLIRLRGDRGCADRLVEYERERAPDVSHVDLIRRAIVRLEHDRKH